MIETSQSTEKLDAALAKAQAEMEVAIKGKVNPAFRTKYADLHSVWEAIRPALSRHGVSITQWPVHSEDGRVHMVTRIAHAGEWIRAQFSIPVAKQDAHGFGSAISYLRRFCSSAALGVVSDEVGDDDGNGAARPAARSSAPDAAPELLGKAKAAAIDGMETYGQFWKSLTFAERTAIGPSRHADFKALASEKPAAGEKAAA